MIKITKLGKRIYGDVEIMKINVYVSSYGIDTFNVAFGYVEHGTQFIIASNPVELVKLLDSKIVCLSKELE